MDIRIENLTVTFDGKSIIGDLSLHLSGRSVCVFGESGCGKSTLLNAIAGLVKPDKGNILGVPERIAYLFQEDRLLPWLNARENVEAVLEKEEKADASDWLQRMGLQNDDIEKRPSQLSGGMKRRVAIARALAFGGELLLLDEPLQALDEERRQDLIGLLKENTKEKSMILITHDMEEAQALCETVIRVQGPPLVTISDG